MSFLFWMPVFIDLPAPQSSGRGFLSFSSGDTPHLFLSAFDFAQELSKMSPEFLRNSIIVIRGVKVILDSDLAELYGVETRRLNEQIRRNIEKFPEDFMFLSTKDEFENLKSQIATSSPGWGGRRKLPLVFTEHGALQAANVLNSGIRGTPYRILTKK
ncbi:MAG: ORF6N domain-containing protein [Pseudomonadota bacterium]